MFNLSVAVATFSANPVSFSPHRTPSPRSFLDHVTRPNEHLAVLLPKDLWKADHLASRCDRFGCPVSFSILERRHHCRKCGGVFCNPCSSRTTHLLDTSALDFLHPPRGVAISNYDSPTSPVLECRICDDCWDQIHGLSRGSHSESASLCSRPSTPSLCSSPLSQSSSGENSLSSSVVATSPNSHTSRSPRKAHSLHTTSSTSSIDAALRRSRPKRMSIKHGHFPLPAELPTERSYGELDAYPLRRSSVLCKATGGGRWEPSHSPVNAGYRPPILGGKAPFEIEMENEEREAKLRKINPVVKDGAFRYRFPKEAEPVILSQSPYHIATF